MIVIPLLIINSQNWCRSQAHSQHISLVMFKSLTLQIRDIKDLKIFVDLSFQANNEQMLKFCQKHTFKLKF